MFFRLLYESFRQRRRKLLAGVAILLGTTAVTAMLALATTIGDRIHKELAVYGANIVVTPQADTLDVKVGGVNLKPATGGAYLHESDLAKLRGIFWANNITGSKPGASRHYHNDRERWDGAPSQRNWLMVWSRVGQWSRNNRSTSTASDLAVNRRVAEEPREAVLGKSLADSLGKKPGDVVYLPLRSAALNTHARVAEGPLLQVVGMVDTASNLDNQILLPLSTAQSLNSTPDAVSRVEISARTKPEDAFANSDPDKLSPKQRDIWYCRPYANSIAYQIREAIPGANAEQVRRVEQSEGTVLSRISGLMWLISAAALLAAGFAVSAAMATAILERRAEIGLMRSLGASRGTIALLFYSETGLLAIFAGGCGYLIGSGLAAWLGAKIFADDGPAISSSMHLSAIATVFNPVLLPIVVGLALLVAIAGSTPAIRAALAIDPSAILRADA